MAAILVGLLLGGQEGIERLGSGDPAVREKAREELRARGGGAVPELTKARADADPEIRLRAEELLEIIARDGLLPLEVRRDASVFMGTRRLVRPGFEADYGELIKVLRDRRSDPRVSEVWHQKRYALFPLVVKVEPETPFEHVARVLQCAHGEGGVVEADLQVGSLKETVSLPVVPRLPGLPTEINDLWTTLCIRSNERNHSHSREKHLASDAIVERLQVFVEKTPMGTLKVPGAGEEQAIAEVFRRVRRETSFQRLARPGRPSLIVDSCPGIPCEYVLLAHRAMTQEGGACVQIHVDGVGYLNRNSQDGMEAPKGLRPEVVRDWHGKSPQDYLEGIEKAVTGDERLRGRFSVIDEGADAAALQGELHGTGKGSALLPNLVGCGVRWGVPNALREGRDLRGEISELRHGGPPEPGDPLGRSIRFRVVIAGAEVEGQAILWFDPATLLPLKRIVKGKKKGEDVSFTEFYEFKR